MKGFNFAPQAAAATAAQLPLAPTRQPWKTKQGN